MIGEDLHSLEKLLTSYLNPLLNTQINNLYSPKPKSLSVEERANRIVNAVVGGNGGNISQYPIGLPGKAFKYLYKGLSASSKTVSLLKRHQCFIVKLFDERQYSQSKVELDTVYCQIMKLLIGEGASGSWLTDGIPIIPGEEGEEGDQVAALIITFNFLYLQYLLQDTSSRIKKDDINLEIIERVIELFQSKSFFSQWLTRSRVKQKHYQNLVKLLKGFKKLVEFLQKKMDLELVQKAVALKLAEYQIHLGIKPEESTIKKIILESRRKQWLESYVTDLCSVIPREAEIWQVLKSKPSEVVSDSMNLDNTPFSIPDVSEFLQPEVYRMIKESPTDETLRMIMKEHLNSKLDVESVLLNQPSSISITVSQIVLATINTSVIPNINSHLHVLDLITIQMKRIISFLEEGNSNTLPVLSILTNLFSAYSRANNMNNNHAKRIRNVSNLLFNLGNRMQSTAPEISIQCWVLCLDYENYIQDGSILSSYREKVEKVINSIYELQAFNQASDMIFRFFLMMLSNANASTSTLEGLKLFHMPLIIQLLVKCIISDTSLVSKIWQGPTIEDNLKTIYYIKVIQFLEKSNNIQEKTDLVNFITQSLQISIPSNKLIAQYEYYNVNGLSNYLDMPQTEDFEEGCENSMFLLFSSGTYFQKLINGQWSDSLFKKCISYFEHWEKQMHSDPFEISFAVTLLQRILKVLCRLDHQRSPIWNILQSFVFPMQTSDKIRIDLIRLEFQLCTGGANSKACEKLLRSTGNLFKSMNPTDINLQDLTNWKLLQLEYYLLFDLDNINKKMVSITEFFLSKINLEDKNLKLEVKFKNLLLVARFRFLTGYKHYNFNMFVEAHSHFKMTIKILHSLIKRIGNNLPKTIYFELRCMSVSLLTEAFYSIIETLMKLGNSNDIHYYLEEYAKVVDSSLTAPQWRHRNWLRISNIYVMLMDKENAMKFSSRALTNDDGNFEINKILLMGLEETIDKLELLQFQTILKSKDYKWKEKLVSTDHIHSMLRKSVFENSFNEFGVTFDIYYLILLWLVNVKKMTVLRVSNSEFQAGFQYLLDLLRFMKSNCLSTYELKDLIAALLNCCLMVDAMDSDIINELFFYFDAAKNLPFDNARKLNASSLVALITDLETELLNKSAIREELKLTDLQAYIPSNWCIITIDYCQISDELQIFRYNRKSNVPEYFKLSVKRWTNRGIEGEISFNDFLLKFREIITLSDISTRKATTVKVKTKHHRKVWWNHRFNLDLQLKLLLDSIEKYWIGGFKLIFGISPSIDSSILLEIKVLLKELLPAHELQHSDLSDRLLSLLLKTYDADQFDDIMYCMLPKVSRNNISRLRIELEKYVLPDEVTDESHLVIIPSTSCTMIPWESLSFMRGKSISRMPSIEGLLNILKKNSLSVLKEKVEPKLYYLINPEGDLKRTESNFGKVFRNKYLEGLIGEKPHEGDLLDHIVNSDVFIYLGHGGCEQYVRPSEINRNCRPLPPSLLIGCSSGALNDNGILEPNGNVYNWLVGGAPMLLVNLWDVTDKDIDKFSLSVFKRWGLFDSNSSNNVNICRAVGLSRDLCMLNYLNGCAPVVYGLPLTLRKN